MAVWRGGAVQTARVDHRPTGGTESTAHRTPGGLIKDNQQTAFQLNHRQKWSRCAGPLHCPVRLARPPPGRRPSGPAGRRPPSSRAAIDCRSLPRPLGPAPAPTQLARFPHSGRPTPSFNPAYVRSPSVTHQPARQQPHITLQIPVRGNS
jgi:hypothetical protein